MKETFEWIHSWSDHAENRDLPRILLVGDSITFGYQEKVREQLKDVCYVDYVSCSYGIDSAFYYVLVTNFIKDNEYAVIHFNNGLHGEHIEKQEYHEKLVNIIDTIKCKLILATSTLVYEKGNEKKDELWDRLVSERNQVVLEVATERKILVDDLFACSCGMTKENRAEDGIHYESNGYQILANQVVDCIKKCFNEQ